MSQAAASSQRIREIPYNYTSFSDREIVIRFLGEEMWSVLNELRGQRQTGRSARMLFEVLGDIWVVRRNPYIQDDLIENGGRCGLLIEALNHRLGQIEARADGNELALKLAAKTREAVAEFQSWIKCQAGFRKKTQRALARITRKDNIQFDGLARVSHATDASDWRVEFPFVVVTPDSEQEVQAVVEVCISLGLTIIPRGGGTGYTGSAVPLEADSVVINVERLEKLNPITKRTLPGVDEPVATITAESGVVTFRLSEMANAAGLTFAVDPTSQHASTIGGNIAMNAGGKKAVRWGTTLDNLVSWKMVTPQAEWLEVERINHNLGKLHDQPFAEFRVQHYEKDGKQLKGQPKILQIPADQLRRPGLGKDVTNKFLAGLPGAQKEGCDGLITSAVFLLHQSSALTQTVCLEFFDPDLHRAVPAIVETIDLLKQHPGVALSGLEHLDERYVKAVNYSTKAARPDLPKMVLLADIGGETEAQLSQAVAAVIEAANARGAEGFVAVSPEARKSFWADRARTAAIAAHTNAFKVNEDVVIPLDRLADYGDGVERINIEQSIHNKLSGLDGLEALIEKRVGSEEKRLRLADSREQQQILFRKVEAAHKLLAQVRSLWMRLLNGLDNEYGTLEIEHNPDLPAQSSLFRLLQRRQLRVSWKREVARPLQEIFSGEALEPLRKQMATLHSELKNRRLFVATHMHAGDGNVHTNIPVHSNNYEMLQEADRVVDRIMKLAQSLGGVISGEHGIGLTKMHYLGQQEVEQFSQYKTEVDPEGRFNRGKLMPGSGLDNAYTPSLQLLAQEALILEANDLGELNHMVKDCLRCGKCKPVCTTHVPAANLLYSPRNKILATGLMIEAVLYEEQTRRGISLRHFEEMNDVADHCTVCHRCITPCPVNIDFGDVTVLMRTILKRQGKRWFKPAGWLAMKFLNITDPRLIKVMRVGMVTWSYTLQRIGHRLMRSAGMLKWQKRPTATTGKPEMKGQLVQFFHRPMPGGMAQKSPRALLGIEDGHYIPIVRNPSRVTTESEALFYFPGCGSERLFGQVELATLNMLYDLDVQTVLPPGYLCCGYPQRASGDAEKGRQISMENRILFHRIANTLNYLDIKTVLVSCGTCMDQLMQYEFEQIFPGCRLLDIHEYLLEKGVKLEQGKGDTQYLFHDPCHSPMKRYSAQQVTTELTGAEVQLSDRCCGESGTFAVTRPDIATQVKFRKEQELKRDTKVLKEAKKILTSCPSCQQGLMRYQDNTGLEVDYLVVEMAKQLHGEAWQMKFLQTVEQGGVEQVLL
ncbi:MAG: DUF3683 domain-containing protein [Gammaproteobacteria bacterium]|jgi:FAD/FMN-containing dehydrogenase/Fe-S oxidoreductase|nr:DUF3683 domain-containing protein [Gammaproteobacteria bacterium]MBT3489866.1 DUF3683 domain-containing protein [Gammaproteobacteria bacterium]MBT3717763.1 DUF3683 domain-containing protein [Gammaproteobacteria bacterium]MBT3844607.1 DUF3683 domain-containing protein [Gammaproteobacteria bacterium]MBT3894103.1 DUF3683 domain-containing protein [Gammaproteobacteria bacterium]